MFYRTLTITVGITASLLFIACEESQQEIGFNKDIAPIIHQNCTPCHRPGEAGPFSLITYQDVKKRAKMVAYVTQIKYMPPWPADPDYRHFIGEKQLEAEEIEKIQQWYNNGAPEGTNHPFPDPPKYAQGSQLGEPDLVVEVPDSVFIPGDNTDRFYLVKAPFEIPQQKTVKAVEFIPGNRALVHHMNGHIVNFDYDKKENVFEGKTWVDPELQSVNESNKALGLLHDDGSYPVLTPLVCSYLPSVTPPIYPKGIGGFKMNRKGAFYMANMHYGPSPIDAYDKSRFNVFFTDEPIERPIFETQMGTLGISEIVPPLVIPPDTVMTVHTRVKIGNAISLLTLNPHMHLIGKSFLAYAFTPKNDTIPLIKIPKWDFRWQYFYTFPKMLKIPAGSIIHAEGVYDNTQNNINNPYSPSRTIREPEGDMKTTDEMFQFIFNYIPYEQGDEDISLE